MDDREDKKFDIRMVLVFIGLVILAALICAVLWHFTHSNGNENDQASQTGMSSEVAVVHTSEPTPEPTTSPEPTATPEVTSTPDTATASEGAVSPGTTTESGATATPGTTTASNVTASPETVQTPAANENATVKDPVSGNQTMSFTDVQETVTAKDVINLRSLPSTADAENIVTQAQNGEVLSRTGINNDTGWSRIDYDGQTLYAVSQYLTTDLTYKTPVQAANPNRVSTKDGRIILFTDCDDNISPKEYVNLRLEPSTTEGNSTVHCQLNYGEVAHRTGYSPDSGWSRVEYDGKVLYVVTSMIYVVTE